MLSKFISIKNVGRFENYKSQGTTDLRRCTLAYAGNGRGKTTLCAILRSLKTGDSSTVVGRRTLKGTGPQEIHIMSDVGQHRFTGTAWSLMQPDIEIFDQTYIAQNVHSGDMVSVDNRRNLYGVVLGAAGAGLVARVDQLDGESRAAAGEVRVAEAAVSAYARGTDLDAFIALTADPESDQRIREKEAEELALTQAEAVRTKPALRRLKLPVVPVELEQVLARSLDGITDDAVVKVRAHLQSHNMGNNGEAWLSRGLAFGGETCPYCDQSLGTVQDKIDAFRVFFGAEYKALQQDIQTVSSAAQAEFGERNITGLGAIARENEEARGFWIPIAGIELRHVEWATFFDSVRVVAGAIEELTTAKRQDPLAKINISERLQEALRSYDASAEHVRQYNEAVDGANSRIALAKTSAAGGNLATVRTELATARLRKLRFEADVATACETLAQARRRHADIGREKDVAKEALEAHAKGTLEAYQGGINDILDKVHAGFTLANAGVDYRGGPASTYQVVINGEAVSLGDANTPDSVPCFRNTLSAGDKSMLALALFVTQLKQDPHVGSKVVVFDDPFSSQDSFRRDHTIRLIRECAGQAKQVIVLSHDKDFLKRLWQRLVPFGDERRALELKRIGPRDTTIVAIDLEDATEALTTKQRQDLVDFYTEGIGTERDVVQKIRPVLESHFRLVGAPAIDPGDNLGVIVTKASAAGLTHPVASAAPDLDELNFYTNRYMHGSNANWQTEPIDSDELVGKVYQALQLTGGC
jgi:wobble nucleotide-excising tRNase